MVSHSEHQALVKALRRMAKDTILGPDSPFSEDEKNKWYAFTSQMISIFDDRYIELRDSQARWAEKAGLIMWYIGFLMGTKGKEGDQDETEVGEAFKEAPF